MFKDPSLPAGMPVELIVSPRDIRSTSIKQKKDKIITLVQTNPILNIDYLNNSVLMTFKEGKKARLGYKAKITNISCDQNETDHSFIEVELLDFIEEYDMRKYPRFNPKLFDRLRISYGDTSFDFEDISAGGVRAICRSDNLKELTKGERISLDVSIGNINYSVMAEVMRIKPTVADSEYYEIAVAFMKWDRNFLHL
jgi:hypothetical protein